MADSTDASCDHRARIQDSRTKLWQCAICNMPLGARAGCDLTHRAGCGCIERHLDALELVAKTAREMVAAFDNLLLATEPETVAAVHASREKLRGALGALDESLQKFDPKGDP